MAPEVDDSKWPLVEIVFPDTITFDDIAGLGQRLLEILERRGPFASVADISALKLDSVTPLHRKKIAEAADRISAMGGFIGEAVVIRNPVVRVLYVGYSWVRRRPEHPVETFGDKSSALAWVAGLLAKRGR